MTGSVRKRGKKWYIVYDEPRLPGEKRKMRWKAVGSKRDAEARLAAVLTGINTGGYTPPNRMTVGEYLAQWLTVQEQRVASKTFERWKGMVERKFIPEFGAVVLSRLSAPQIQTVYAKWQRDGGRRGAGMSPLTIKHYHRALSHALKRAVSLGYVARNVCDAVEPPRVERSGMQALNETQVQTLFQALKGTPLEFIVKLAVYTGLRRGELLALKWSAIDFGRQLLAVTHTLEQTRIGGLKLKPPKSAKGRRTVNLPAIICEDLRRLRVQQRKQRLSLGVSSSDDDYVFSHPSHPANRPWTPDLVTGSFRWHVDHRAPDLPRIRFHDLRHSSASLLLKAGVPLKVVSERLGHSTTALTGDVYAHVLEGMDRKAADTLAAALERGA
jgi:integrase